MALTLASTTESQEQLNFAASADWRTPPAAKPGDLPPADKNGEIVLDKLPPKLYNEVRDQQIAEKKAEGPEFLKAYRKKGSGGYRKVIGAATRSWKSEEARAIAAENRVAELEAQLNGAVPAETAAPESFEAPNAQQQDGTRPTETPQKAKQYAAGAEKYPDFAAAMDEADRADLKVSDRAKTAILASRNRADIVYWLAKNPEVCHELLTEPDNATNKVGEISASLMRNPPESTPQPQQPPADQASVRHDQLLSEHQERMKALNPRDVKAIQAAIRSGLDVSLPAYAAILEQPNSQDVLRYLVIEEPEKLAELNGLTPFAAMSRIGRIAERLEAKAAAKRERASPPAPISPVGASSSRTGISLDELPMREYIAARNKQEFLRKREGRR